MSEDGTPPDPARGQFRNWLDLSPEEFDALAVRLWCPVPESLRRSLREIWNAPKAEAPAAERARLQERALLALPLLAVGLSVPDAEPPAGDARFALDFARVAADVRAVLVAPERPMARRSRTLARMRDAAERAARLCGDEDGARWLPRVRKSGLRKFVSVLDKAERMKGASAKDANGKPVRDWGAYFSRMLAKAGKAETERGVE